MWGKDVLTNLIVGIISKYIQTENHYTVSLKLAQQVMYLSVKLVKTKRIKEWNYHLCLSIGNYYLRWGYVGSSRLGGATLRRNVKRLKTIGWKERENLGPYWHCSAVELTNLETHINDLSCERKMHTYIYANQGCYLKLKSY